MLVFTNHKDRPSMDGSAGRAFFVFLSALLLYLVNKKICDVFQLINQVGVSGWFNAGGAIKVIVLPVSIVANIHWIYLP